MKLLAKVNVKEVRRWITSSCFWKHFFIFTLRKEKCNAIVILTAGIIPPLLSHRFSFTMWFEGFKTLLNVKLQTWTNFLLYLRAFLYFCISNILLLFGVTYILIIWAVNPLLSLWAFSITSSHSHKYRFNDQNEPAKYCLISKFWSCCI